MDPRLKLFLYSAHEVTIAGFLKALDIPMAEVPSYSSAVMIELRKSTLGIDYVQVIFPKFVARFMFLCYFALQLLYYNGDPPTIRKLRIPGCDVKCPLKDFLQLTRHVWPSDEELQCDRHWFLQSLTNNYFFIKKKYNIVKSAEILRNRSENNETRSESVKRIFKKYEKVYANVWNISS